MHGLGGFLSTTSTKPTWSTAGDTLESIVHQATCNKQDATSANIASINGASSGRKWVNESSGQVQGVPELTRKRIRSDSEPCNGRNCRGSLCGDSVDLSACASAAPSASTATVSRDNDTTRMTCTSFVSTRSLKTKTTDEDSSCHGGSGNPDEDREKNNETGRSQSTRRNRVAATHNQSERRRRDRINQKMKTLQKLVPNATKTDKATMLDEVIEYLKQLQAQVQMMSMRSMAPQMVLPLGMQQHLQMSLLARMGMGVGVGMSMGMLDVVNSMARSVPQTLPSLIHPGSVTATAPTFVSSAIVVPPLIPTHPPAQAKPNLGNNTLAPFPDPYGAYLAQSMNMDLYNKMSALYRQQVNQTTQAMSSPSQSPHVQSS